MEENPKRLDRQRSPAYPFMDLQAALARAQTLYAKERRGAVNALVAASHWGYKPKSSGGVQTIAALKSFGLIKDSGSGAGRTIQLTEEALRILTEERSDTSEKDSIIKKLALLPRIHHTLWEQYKGELPSNEQLKHDLQWNYKFNPNVIQEFIRVFKATLAFAKLKPGDKEDLASPDAEEDNSTGENQFTEPLVSPPGKVPENKTLPPKGSAPTPLSNSAPVGAAIPVTRECTMSIWATGRVTQKGVEQLIAYLNLIKLSFPTDDEAIN